MCAAIATADDFTGTGLRAVDNLELEFLDAMRIHLGFDGLLQAGAIKLFVSVRQICDTQCSSHRDAELNFFHVMSPG